MRIRLDKLVNQDDALTFNQTAFTGVVYDVREDGVVTAISNVVQGRIIGLHQDWSIDKARCDQGKLQWSDVDDLPRLDGEVFDGIAYEFDFFGMLESETHIDIQSEDWPYKEWHPQGTLKAIGCGGYDRRQWHEHGTPHVIQLHHLSILFDAEGRLMRIRWEVDCRANPCELTTLAVSNTLHLIGGAINDQFVCQLVGLERLTLLDLEETCVTNAGLAAFDVCVDLRYFKVNRNKDLSSKQCRDFLARKPECELIDAAR